MKMDDFEYYFTCFANTFTMKLAMHLQHKLAKTLYIEV